MSATGLEILPASPRCSGHTPAPFGSTVVAPYHAADGPVPASALSQHPLAAQAVGEVGRSRSSSSSTASDPDLVVCFVSPHHVGAFEDIATALRKLLEPGCSSAAPRSRSSAAPHEVEDAPRARACFAARFADAGLTPVALDASRTRRRHRGRRLARARPTRAHAPAARRSVHFPVDAFLAPAQRRRPGAHGHRRARLGRARSRAATASSLDDARRGRPARSACSSTAVSRSAPSSRRAAGRSGARSPSPRPSATSSRSSAGKPAIERLQEVAAAATDDERELIRARPARRPRRRRARSTSAGATSSSATCSAPTSAPARSPSATQVDVGQTVQFHVRDADAADEDLRELLAGVDAGGRAAVHLQRPRHAPVRRARPRRRRWSTSCSGPLPLAGAFCAGEIGPVGGTQLPARVHRQPRPVPMRLPHPRTPLGLHGRVGTVGLRAPGAERGDGVTTDAVAPDGDVRGGSSAQADRRDPRPRDGRGAEGELRPPGHADGARAARARAVHARS